MCWNFLFKMPFYQYLIVGHNESNFSFCEKDSWQIYREQGKLRTFWQLHREIGKSEPSMELDELKNWRFHCSVHSKLRGFHIRLQNLLIRPTKGEKEHDSGIISISGPVEAGVPRHTQYLALHLVKTMFIPENSGVGYLCTRPMFSGFHRLCWD